MIRLGGGVMTVRINVLTVFSTYMPKIVGLTSTIEMLQVNDHLGKHYLFNGGHLAKVATRTTLN